MKAVFEEQVDCYRHKQCHKSKKSGKLKWAMMEMWPMTVCLSFLYITTLHCYLMCCTLTRIHHMQAVRNACIQAAATLQHSGSTTAQAACPRPQQSCASAVRHHAVCCMCSVLVHIQMLDSSTGLKRGLLFLWGANSSSEPPAICLVARAAV